MQVNIQNVIIIISLTKLQRVYIKCTFVMLFLFSNTEYGFIGVHWGFTPTPGIILNTHTMIRGYHGIHSSTPNNREEFTVSDYVQYCHAYFNSQALSDTSFGGRVGVGVQRRERVDEGEGREVTIKQVWECKFETLVH